VKGYPLPPMYTQFHPRSPKAGAPDTRGSRVVGRRLRHQAEGHSRGSILTTDHSAVAGGVPGLFSSFVANKSTSPIRPKRVPCVTLGSPLGDAWETLGSPKPNPNPNPNRQRVATPKCKNPASSRVKSLVWHSRSRLCVLNQSSRGAQPPSAADACKHRRPTISASRRCSSHRRS
jgi:hypothetical protein